ncbi:MAG: hypothetical protein K0Q94_4762 [Paenibacillus sp.]|jgi:hypothetical protein|nr:hypothetical protein [Paenibacillus sp.]
MIVGIRNRGTVFRYVAVDTGIRVHNIRRFRYFMPKIINRLSIRSC